MLRGRETPLNLSGPVWILLYFPIYLHVAQGGFNVLSKPVEKAQTFIVDPDRTLDGFLAHEVQTVVPEAITGEHNEVDEDGNPVYQQIDQSKIVPLLTAALQEALSEIADLKTRVAALETP